MLRNYESGKMGLQDIILDCDIVSIGDALAEALAARDKHVVAQFFKVIEDQKKKIMEHSPEQADAWLSEIKEEAEALLWKQKVEKGQSRDH